MKERTFIVIGLDRPGEQRRVTVREITHDEDQTIIAALLGGVSGLCGVQQHGRKVARKHRRNR